MELNYILLAVTGIFSAFALYDRFSGKQQVSLLWTIAVVIVFVIVVCATFMGITYDQLIAQIEGRA